VEIRLHLEYVYRFSPALVETVGWRRRRIHGLVSSTLADEQFVSFPRHFVAAGFCICVANAPCLPCHILHKRSDISLPAPSCRPVRNLWITHEVCWPLTAFTGGLLACEGVSHPPSRTPFFETQDCDSLTVYPRQSPGPPFLDGVLLYVHGHAFQVRLAVKCHVSPRC
jgi:hypothetical protein